MDVQTFISNGGAIGRFHNILLKKVLFDPCPNVKFSVVSDLSEEALNPMLEDMCRVSRHRFNLEDERTETVIVALDLDTKDKTFEVTYILDLVDRQIDKGGCAFQHEIFTDEEKALFIALGGGVLEEAIDDAFQNAYTKSKCIPLTCGVVYRL